MLIARGAMARTFNKISVPQERSRSPNRRCSQCDPEILDLAVLGVASLELNPQFAANPTCAF
jgi:hypothetical protein